VCVRNVAPNPCWITNCVSTQVDACVEAHHLVAYYISDIDPSPLRCGVPESDHVHVPQDVRHLLDTTAGTPVCENAEIVSCPARQQPLITHEVGAIEWPGAQRDLSRHRRQFSRNGIRLSGRHRGSEVDAAAAAQTTAGHPALAIMRNSGHAASKTYFYHRYHLYHLYQQQQQQHHYHHQQ
jgi:hypothetical protein